MDNSSRFLELRDTYKEFYFNEYTIHEDDDGIYLEFDFEIPGLTKFNPRYKILRKSLGFKSIDSNYVRNMVFHIGLIELISYWKCACSPKIVVKCGFLNDEQIAWWKKLYFYGLGELFYRNNINVDIQNFVSIECLGNNIEYEKIEDESNGYIVPIGGGKDSVVTLETLKVDVKNDFCLIVNPKTATLQCAEVAGFEYNNIIEVYRSIDRNLIGLNDQGFINGHTPFSAMLAFLTYFVAYMLSKKYVALSNENSANESNIIGEKVNHQYSKSFEFECDFIEYADKYLKAPVKYFSFLRPLNELQIAKIFSRHEKYHSVFKSCNVGSKEKEWKWCCNCAKCLFAYTILSPYLYKDKLVKIFGEDLFEREDLLQIFIDLTGNGDVKPFDCVGTFEEVNYAISKTIKNIEEKADQLPYLLRHYKDNYSLVNVEDDITLRYNEDNNLNEEQNELLRREVFLSDK
ncbi:MAG: hypothetical protein IKR04_06690 [Clostridia bacterium]|nr:hypothetical protein [Clostridia bacterium]